MIGKLLEFSADDLFYALPQEWNIVVRRRPDDIPLDCEVSVYGDVSKRDDVTPFNLSVGPGTAGGDVPQLPR